MPRKKLIYTHLYPYHVMARSNNKEFFYIEKELLWKIFIYVLNQLVIKYKIQIHAFVLIDNHYHLILTVTAKYNLSFIMQELQKSVSRRVNSKTGRINHVFGGPYKASLIQTPEYYFNVYKYLYRNPIEAGLCRNINHYKFSSINTDAIPLTSPLTGIASYIPNQNVIEWLNKSENEKWLNSISKGLKKTVFKPVIDRSY